ncbi:SDR family NAD(P)-dependent oxidoreductase [Enterococcus alishanensis]
MEKYTLITGASSGIGKSFAKYFAKARNNLIIVARSKDKLNELKKDLEGKYQVKIIVLIYDMTIPDISIDIYKEIRNRNIFVDKLINCAGFGLSGNVDNLSYDKQHNQIMINAIALFDMTKLFLDPMLNNNEGIIINVASTSAYHPIPTMAVYAASKAFVLSFTEALAIECNESNVKVLAISPGATDTNFFSEGGGVSYGNLRTPDHVVSVSMKAIKRKKISKIDGLNNYFTSTFLPRILSRKKMANMVYNIMKKQTEKS